MSLYGSTHNVCLVKGAQHMHAVSLSYVSVICCVMLAQFVGQFILIYFHLYMYSSCTVYTKCAHTKSELQYK